jgi:3-deoxy-D-manno-octulosonic-acid transferase
LFFPFLWRRIRPEEGCVGKWQERFGCFPAETVRKLKAQKNIWFQTVSVGELLAVTPLIRTLRERFPAERIVLTVTTRTGRNMAAKNFPDIPCFFFPLDFSLVAARTLRVLNSKLIVLVETEIWPSLLRLAHRRKTPVIIVNGRVSPRSFSRYRKFRPFLKEVLPLLTEVAMRTEKEAGRLRYLGAPAEIIRVVGSIKFDQAYGLSTEIKPAEVRQRYGLPEDRKIVVFGSLHPAEEEPVTEVARQLLKDYPGILTVIVPRFLDRTNIFRVLAGKSISYARLSRLPEGRTLPVWVVDTYGELNNFYSICEFAFVGGSLVAWGGQNPIEPAAFARPILFGKYQWHFFEEWGKIKQAGGGTEVTDYQDLLRQMRSLLQNPEQAKSAGENAFQAVLKNRGATEKNLRIISRYLGGKGAGPPR